MRGQILASSRFFIFITRFLNVVVDVIVVVGSVTVVA
jgi:hypothetical protein